MLSTVPGFCQYIVYVWLCLSAFLTYDVQQQYKHKGVYADQPSNSFRYAVGEAWIMKLVMIGRSVFVIIILAGCYDTQVY
jgi:hypothetical protein